MFKSKVYFKDSLIGIANVYLERNCEIPQRRLQPLKIFEYQNSPTCSPLALLQAVSPHGAIFKLRACEAEMETSGQGRTPHHFPSMHRTMMSRNRTAIIKLDNDEEIHLVAMACRDPWETRQVFWGFHIVKKVHLRYYPEMIDNERLSLILNLDETLLVFNTVESFEKKIKDLKEKIDTEADTDLVYHMIEERRRYAADLELLEQYINRHQVVFDGKWVPAVSEDIHGSSLDCPATILPVIRLKDSNIVLTRIWPHRPESSILVRTRPGWDTLYKYLSTHRPDKKPFSICILSTVLEANVRLELWRVLDPQYKLIQPNHLLDRVVSNSPGASKSLPKVCPRMVLAMDNTTDSWMEGDKGRVHVIPAFKGYDKPFEEQLLDDALQSARALAEKVRHRFFNKFNQVFVPKLAEIRYEDVVQEVVPPVDVKLLLDELKHGDGAARTSGVRDQSAAGTSGVRNESAAGTSGVRNNESAAGTSGVRNNESAAGSSGVRYDSIDIDQIASASTPRDMNGVQLDMMMQYLARDQTSNSQSSPRQNIRSRDPRTHQFRTMNCHIGDRSSSQNVQEVEPLLNPRRLDSSSRQQESVTERSGGETPRPAAQTNAQSEIRSMEATTEQTENGQEVEQHLLIPTMESLGRQPESALERSGGETPRPAAQRPGKEVAGTLGMRNEPIFNDQIASTSASGNIIRVQQDMMHHLAMDQISSQSMPQLNSRSRDSQLHVQELCKDGPLLIPSTESPTRQKESLPERPSRETLRPAAQENVENEIRSTEAATEQTNSASVLAKICLKNKLDLVYELQQPQSTMMNQISAAEGFQIDLQIKINEVVIASGSGPTWTSAVAPAADLALERLREHLLVSSRVRQGLEAVPEDVILQEANDEVTAYWEEQTSAVDPQAADGVLEGLPQHRPSSSRTRSRRRRRSESTPQAPQDSPSRRVSSRVRKPKKFEDCVTLDSSDG